MLALIESRRQQDGLVRWLVKDGTDDSPRQRVYCVCDAYADAETIAACLNACHRIATAGRLVVQACKERSIPEGG